MIFDEFYYFLFNKSFVNDKLNLDLDRKLFQKKKQQINKAGWLSKVLELFKQKKLEHSVLMFFLNLKFLS